MPCEPCPGMEEIHLYFLIFLELLCLAFPIKKKNLGLRDFNG